MVRAGCRFLRAVRIDGVPKHVRRIRPADDRGVCLGPDDHIRCGVGRRSGERRYAAFLGWLYDRYGGRIVISLSLLVLGAATMLLSMTNNFWFLLGIYGFVTSTATSGVSLVTIHALLSKWFHEKRSLVLSLATAGTSAGSLLLVPLASSLIEAANWRVTWLVLGAIVIFLALPVVLFIVKDSPEEVGELPDGEKASESPGLRCRVRSPGSTGIRHTGLTLFVPSRSGSSRARTSCAE